MRMYHLSTRKSTYGFLLFCISPNLKTLLTQIQVFLWEPVKHRIGKMRMTHFAVGFIAAIHLLTSLVYHWASFFCHALARNWLTHIQKSTSPCLLEIFDSFPHPRWYMLPKMYINRGDLGSFVVWMSVLIIWPLRPRPKHSNPRS